MGSAQSEINYPPAPKSEISFNLSEAGEAGRTERDHFQSTQSAERDIMNLGLNVPTMMQQPTQMDEN